jgi:hypothetical protein
MSTMSPELALVDPELRADAIARLPPIYVNAFLQFPAAPIRVVPAPKHSSPTVSATLAYLMVAIGRTLAFDALVFASIAALVLLANLL